MLIHLHKQLPQTGLGSKPPLQAMKDWHTLKPELSRKQLYYLAGCDMRGVGCDCLGLAPGVWREVVGAESLPMQCA